MWQAYRTPWSMSSGGVHSGIHKSTDGGATWTKLTGTARGLPSGVVGKIGLAVSPAKPSRVWAMIEHDSGGLYRSDDAGQSWSYINKERKLRQRAWYYSMIAADPKDTNVIYGLNVGMFRSKDGGRTFPETLNPPHGDNHDLWIAPDNPDRMVQANDGGANVSLNRGASWTARSSRPRSSTTSARPRVTVQGCGGAAGQHDPLRPEPQGGRRDHGRRVRRRRAASPAT
jgi:hypothetical protein